jgi:hypothetical protein
VESSCCNGKDPTIGFAHPLGGQFSFTSIFGLGNWLLA